MPSDHRRGPLETGQRDVILGIKDTVNLSAACLKARGPLRLGNFLFLHRPCEMPGDHLLYRLQGHLHPLEGG